MDKTPHESLSLSRVLRNDQFCNRFEADFRAGRVPHIEDFLSLVPPAEQADLLRDLVRLECELNSRNGVPASLDDYLRRFPGHALLIRDVLAAIAAETRIVPGSTAEDEANTTLSQSADSIQTSRSARPHPSRDEAAAAPPLKNFGRYVIEKELGKGAMGVVYLAEDTQLGRKVALKIPKQSILEEPDALQRFYREARTTSQIRHPNICPVYDVGNIGGTHYLTMAYIPGKPVSSYIGKKLPASRQVAALIRKIALALAEAHKNGIIHRDLKPSNVMLDDRGEPIVMDFGLARQMNTAENARLTQSGAILGTPAYMAPEQVNGDATLIGPASDVYALGVMLYQFLTGVLPFNGPMLRVFAQIANEQPKPPSQVRPEVDPALEAICLKMMDKDIGRRYASMKAVAKDLTEYLKPSSSGSSEPIISGSESQTLPLIVAEPDERWPLGRTRPKSLTKTSRLRRRQMQILAVGIGVMALLAIAISRYTETPKTNPGTNGSVSSSDETTPNSKAKTNPAGDIVPGDRNRNRDADSDVTALLPEKSPGAQLQWLGYAIYTNPIVVEQVSQYTNVVIHGGWMDEGDRVVQAARSARLPVILVVEGEAKKQGVFASLPVFVRQNRDAVAGVMFHDSDLTNNDTTELKQQLRSEFPRLQFWLSDNLSDDNLAVSADIDVLVPFFMQVNFATRDATETELTRQLPRWIKLAKGRPIMLNWVCPYANGPQAQPETLRRCAEIVVDHKLAGMMLWHYGPRPRYGDNDPGFRVHPELIDEAKRISLRYGIQRDSENSRLELSYINRNGEIVSLGGDASKPTIRRLASGVPRSLAWNDRDRQWLVMIDEELVPIDDSGQRKPAVLRFPSDTKLIEDVDISSDGTRAAWTRHIAGGVPHIMVQRFDQEQPVDLNYGYDPIWTQDGKDLVFTTAYNPPAIAVWDGRQATNIALPEAKLHPRTSIWPAPSPDDRYFIFGVKAEDGSFQLGQLSSTGSFVRQLTSDGDRYRTHTRVSPDGKFVAFLRHVGFNWEIAVFDLVNERETLVATDAAKIRPAWRTIPASAAETATFSQFLVQQETMRQEQVAELSPAAAEQRAFARRILSLGGSVWIKRTPRELGYSGLVSLDPWPPEQIVWGMSLKGSAVDDATLGQFSDAPHFEILSLDNTTVTAQGIERMQGRKLNTLEIKNSTSVDVPFMKAIRSIETLGVVYFENASVTDEGLAELRGMLKVNYLGFERVSLSDEGLKHLAALPNLNFIKLDRQLLSATGVEYLGEISNRINLVSNLNDKALERLLPLQNLEVLTLDFRSQVSATGALSLPKMAELRRLMIYCPIDDNWVDSLSQMSKLQYLNIGPGCNLSAESRRKLRAALPDCQIYLSKDGKLLD